MLDRTILGKVSVLLLVMISCTLASQLEELDVQYSPSVEHTAFPRIDGSDIKNIVIMIGDGMGLAHIAGTRIYALGPDELLYIERMPVTGLINTHASNRLITDSAAAATAIATGVKTENGVIGQSPDGKELVSIFDAGKTRAMKLGLISTSSLTHATPASFIAHNKSRSNQYDIADQMSKWGIDLMFGGGGPYFLPSNEGGKRKDGRNLFAEMRDRDVKIVHNRFELLALEHTPVVGVFNLEEKALRTRSPEPTLAEMTTKAIELLDADDSGFMLMVEGSQIDWEAHDNDEKDMYRQLLLFDDAVRVALNFALEDSKTLVLVTADHETGGLTLTDGSLEGSDLEVKWEVTGHTATPVPIFAFGPGAENFTGLYDNTEIAKKIAKLMNFKEVEIVTLESSGVD